MSSSPVLDFDERDSYHLQQIFPQLNITLPEKKKTESAASAIPRLPQINVSRAPFITGGQSGCSTFSKRMLSQENVMSPTSNYTSNSAAPRVDEHKAYGKGKRNGKGRKESCSERTADETGLHCGVGCQDDQQEDSGEIRNFTAVCHGSQDTDVTNSGTKEYEQQEISGKSLRRVQSQRPGTRLVLRVPVQNYLESPYIPPHPPQAKRHSNSQWMQDEDADLHSSVLPLSSPTNTQPSVLLPHPPDTPIRANGQLRNGSDIPRSPGLQTYPSYATLSQGTQLLSQRRRKGSTKQHNNGGTLLSLELEPSTSGDNLSRDMQPHPPLTPRQRSQGVNQGQNGKGNREMQQLQQKPRDSASQKGILEKGKSISLSPCLQYVCSCNPLPRLPCYPVLPKLIPERYESVDIRQDCHPHPSLEVKTVDTYCQEDNQEMNADSTFPSSQSTSNDPLKITVPDDQIVIRKENGGCISTSSCNQPCQELSQKRSVNNIPSTSGFQPHPPRAPRGSNGKCLKRERSRKFTCQASEVLLKERDCLLSIAERSATPTLQDQDHQLQDLTAQNSDDMDGEGNARKQSKGSDALVQHDESHWSAQERTVNGTIQSLDLDPHIPPVPRVSNHQRSSSDKDSNEYVLFQGGVKHCKNVTGSQARTKRCRIRSNSEIISSASNCGTLVQSQPRIKEGARRKEATVAQGHKTDALLSPSDSNIVTQKRNSNNTILPLGREGQTVMKDWKDVRAPQPNDQVLAINRRFTVPERNRKFSPLPPVSKAPHIFPPQYFGYREAMPEHHVIGDSPPDIGPQISYKKLYSEEQFIPNLHSPPITQGTSSCPTIQEPATNDTFPTLSTECHPPLTDTQDQGIVSISASIPFPADTQFYPATEIKGNNSQMTDLEHHCSGASSALQGTDCAGMIPSSDSDRLMYNRKRVPTPPDTFRERRIGVLSRSQSEDITSSFSSFDSMAKNYDMAHLHKVPHRRRRMSHMTSPCMSFAGEPNMGTTILCNSEQQHNTGNDKTKPGLGSVIKRWFARNMRHRVQRNAMDKKCKGQAVDDSSKRPLHTIQEFGYSDNDEENDDSEHTEWEVPGSSQPDEESSVFSIYEFLNLPDCDNDDSSDAPVK